jgi:hypothetical protein
LCKRPATGAFSLHKKHVLQPCGWQKHGSHVMPSLTIAARAALAIVKSRNAKACCGAAGAMPYAAWKV